jgi:hypothetical protein
LARFHPAFSAVNDDVPQNPAPIAIILTMERLVQVAIEIHYKFESSTFGGTIPNWIAQNCEKILDLQYNTAAIGALPRQVDVGVRQRDVNGYHGPVWG